MMQPETQQGELQCLQPAMLSASQSSSAPAGETFEYGGQLPTAPLQGHQQSSVVVAHTQSTQILSVAVPQGAQPGQQVQFITPSGHTASVTVVEYLAPGATLSVQVPTATAQAPRPPAQMETSAPTGPLLPPMPTVNLADDDEYYSRMNWGAYFVSWICFCCCPWVCGHIIAMLVWAGLAIGYFCKPQNVREHLPRQRVPAQVSAITAICTCFCFLAMAAAAGFMWVVCGGDIQNCSADGNWDIKLTGFKTSSGCFQHDSQAYAYEGRTARGYAYYRGAVHTNRYLYFEPGCDETKLWSVWVLGDKPDVLADYCLGSSKVSPGQNCPQDAYLSDWGRHQTIETGRDFNWTTCCHGEYSYQDITIQRATVSEEIAALSKKPLNDLLESAATTVKPSRAEMVLPTDPPAGPLEIPQNNQSAVKIEKPTPVEPPQSAAIDEKMKEANVTINI